MLQWLKLTKCELLSFYIELVESKEEAGKESNSLDKEPNSIGYHFYNPFYAENTLVQGFSSNKVMVCFSNVMF